ncbi:unnamed protein product [Prorocentrum cordatum]|uniref:ER lumen protein-retaining receptor n=1 Tax=Prorocentrum cordatum TaxID=2364126 RepID=A0ABN9RGL0_9DINO|nr:unnamed protein product [Polarella glacialis]
MIMAMKDSDKLAQKVMTWLSADACKAWGGFVLVAVAVFWLFSSGSFSFILTLSSLVSLFSFLGVLVGILQMKSARGISCKMIECYCLVFVGRLIAIVPFEGYLPFDRSGDWFYQLSEGIALSLAMAIVYLCRGQCAATYDRHADSLNSLWLIVPALVIALVIHPHLNNHTPTDICWAFSLYLESVAVLCQFWMFMSQGKARPHITHFLAAQALSKFMSFIFWASSFSELTNKNHYIKELVAFWVVGMQMVQILIMVDFIHNYLFALSRGSPCPRSSVETATSERGAAGWSKATHDRRDRGPREGVRDQGPPWRCPSALATGSLAAAAGDA